MGKPPSRPSPSLDRLPPHSIEGEMGVIGSVLLSPDTAMDEAVNRLSDPAAFYDLRHRTIWQTLLSMWENRWPIDMLTVQQTLADIGQLDAVGGRPYVSSLPDACPSGANITYYLKIVEEKFVLRKLLGAASELVASVYEPAQSSNTVQELAESVFLKICDARQRNGEVRPTMALVRQALARMEDDVQGKPVEGRIKTGYPDLDKALVNLTPGNFVVIAARPSMGKTSLAMNIADYVTVEERLPVGVFSLEMDAESVVHRMISARARARLADVREGFGNKEKTIQSLSVAGAKIAGAPLHIDDTPGLTILQLRARARRMLVQFKVQLIIIDYLQLILPARRDPSRQREVSEISAALKGMARELKVPVLCLCQLNRDVERRTSRRPQLSDLRESGAIENDADAVLLLYTPEAPDPQDYGALPVNLFIAKQRNGPTGEIPLTFIRTYTRFESAAKVSIDDVPRPDLDLPEYNDQGALIT